MKHLIIPTDFSLRSLEPLRAAVTHFAGEPLTVTLMHLLEPPTDILDGLRVAYRAEDKPAVPRAFTLALESVTAVHKDQIHAVKVGTWYGSTTVLARNLLEHLGIDAVVFDPHMPFDLPAPHSIDPRPLLRRAMPRNIVETGAALSGTVAAPQPAAGERPMRPAPTRLQPAMHDMAETVSNPTTFSHHAS